LPGKSSQNILQQAYDKSLSALSIALDSLRGADKQVNKTISLLKADLNLYLHIEPDNRDVKLHGFKRNSPLGAMFEHILSHPNEVISSGTLKFESQGYSNKRDIPEDLRAGGITVALKRLFFPVCNTDEIKFVNRAELSQAKLDILLTGAKPDFRK
jgi:hypothetical protein